MGGHTLHLVFYYKSNPFVDSAMPSDLGNLRVTLSELLDEYPLVTGRLTRGPEGEWLVKFNDAGVRMLQVVVDATLDEWLRSADAAEERDLTVWEEMPDDPSFWSPFRVQITNFKCGGIALGLSCTHILADITSATMLIKSCALVHRHQPPTNPPIFHLPTTTPSPHPSGSSTTTPPKMATATFKFSASAVQKCLSQARPRCPDATPFDVLAALFWSHVHGGKRSLSICLDCRSIRGKDPIPYQYFGNALCFSTLAVDAGELLASGGLGQVSACVHRHVAEMRKEGFSLVASLLEENGNCGGGDEASRVYGAGRLTCVNAEHMIEAAETGGALMYEAEFKKGERPVHVSCHVGNVGGEGLIMVLPSAEGGLGRTVTATLPEEQVAELCKDQAILDLEPTMILCGKR